MKSSAGYLLGAPSPVNAAPCASAESSCAGASPRQGLQITATREHLRVVFFARLVVLAAVLAYLGGGLLRGDPVRVSEWAWGLILLAALVNAATWQRLHHPRPVSHAEFLLQILADVGLIAAGLHYTGGDTSPLVVLNLVPLTIAAATLPWRHTAVVFVAVVAAHELVCVYLPNGEWLAPVNRNTDLVDLMAAGLIAYFVSSMARTTREHDNLLRRIREDYLRQRHSADMGALAAYAAHQLSSPLATIAILVNDMRTGGWRRGEVDHALDVMAQEIQTCKEVASRLLASAGHNRAEGGHRIAADRFLATIVDRCHLMQPWMAVECRHEGTPPAPEILAEASLEQAIFVLLNRPPGATRRVDVSQRWDDSRLHIHICHCDADGCADGPRRRKPARALSSTDHLDVLMARHTVGAFGGTVDDVIHSDGQPCFRLSLPLNSLRTSRHASHAAN